MATTSTRISRRRAAPGARLFRFDRSLGGRLVAGTDEAGRGCLAGPLVAAAVVFDPHALTRSARRDLMRLNDSKKLTATAREEMAAAVLTHAREVVVRVGGAPSIDRDGLHRTNLDLLARCLAALGCTPDVCLVDGFSLPAPAPPHRAIVGGDRTSAAIAAASIIAKTTRDHLMCGPVSARWPDYGFDRHVGYGTREHQRALRTSGITAIHRRSFNSAAYMQTSLFDDAFPEGSTAASEVPENQAGR